MANPLFISYRRCDTTGEAGRLAESLEQQLGSASVFRDADDIVPGEDFVVTLESELAGTRAVIVLIGKQWLGELTARLKRPEPDYVRIEVATALRLGKTVIPVLLNGAELPAAEALPDDLRSLVRRQVLNLRDEAWAQDAGRLADAIGRPYRWRHLALRAALAIPVSLLATKTAVDLMAPNAENQLALARLLLMGLLALYGGLEFGLWWRQRRKKA